jgi:hypothetical protein
MDAYVAPTPKWGGALDAHYNPAAAAAAGSRSKARAMEVKERKTKREEFQQATWEVEERKSRRSRRWQSSRRIQVPTVEVLERIPEWDFEEKEETISISDESTDPDLFTPPGSPHSDPFTPPGLHPGEELFDAKQFLEEEDSRWKSIQARFPGVEQFLDNFLVSEQGREGAVAGGGGSHKRMRSPHPLVTWKDVASWDPYIMESDGTVPPGVILTWEECWGSPRG